VQLRGWLIMVLHSCKDLGAQNALLYQHLDTVSSQASRIRQVADSSAENPSGEADVNGDTGAKLSELRAVVAYLRKEKEIVDLQLELCKQENIRLKAQIENLNQSLQEARSTLSEVIVVVYMRLSSPIYFRRRNENVPFGRPRPMPNMLRCSSESTSLTSFGRVMPPFARTARTMPSVHASWTLGSRRFPPNWIL